MYVHSRGILILFVIPWNWTEIENGFLTLVPHWLIAQSLLYSAVLWGYNRLILALLSQYLSTSFNRGCRVAEAQARDCNATVAGSIPTRRNRIFSVYISSKMCGIQREAFMIFFNLLLHSNKSIKKNHFNKLKYLFSLSFSITLYCLVAYSFY